MTPGHYSTGVIIRRYTRLAKISAPAPDPFFRLRNWRAHIFSEISTFFAIASFLGTTSYDSVSEL